MAHANLARGSSTELPVRVAKFFYDLRHMLPRCMCFRIAFFLDAPMEDLARKKLLHSLVTEEVANDCSSKPIRVLPNTYLSI